MFDAMDRSRCIEILEDAVVGPQAICLVNASWKKEVLNAEQLIMKYLKPSKT